MTTWRQIKTLLIYLGIGAVIYFGSDWVTPLLGKSAFFHGVMVAAGVASLPIFALLLRIEQDPRPFPPGARYPRLLLGAFFFTLSTGMIFWGLGFWLGWARAAGYGLGGAALACALLVVILLLRADRASQKATKARDRTLE